MEIDSELTEKAVRNNQHPLKMTATISTYKSYTVYISALKLS